MDKNWLEKTAIDVSIESEGDVSIESEGVELSAFADKVLAEAAKANCLYCRTSGLPTYKGGSDWIHRESTTAGGFTVCRSVAIWNLVGNKEQYRG